MIIAGSTDPDSVAERSAPVISAALAGCTILLPVDRRSGELSAALERHGAAVRLAPALTIVPHIDDEELIARSRMLIADPPDIVVVTTGVGFRGWVEAVDEAGLLEEFLDAVRPAQIVARGPKARGAIQQAGLAADWVAESETAAELEQFLLAEGVSGRRIAVQHHGSGADGLDEAFEAAGADVVVPDDLPLGSAARQLRRPSLRRRGIGRRIRRDPVHLRARGSGVAGGGGDPAGPARDARARRGRPPADGGGGADHRRTAAGRRLRAPHPRSRTAGLARARRRHLLRRRAGTRASRRSPAGSNCAAPASSWTAGTSRSPAWAWTSSRLSPTRAAAPSRAKSCRARCPARSRIRTPSRSPWRACARRSGCPT